MSYHTHNLKVGDEFWDTKDLDANTKKDWHWWKVTYVGLGEYFEGVCEEVLVRAKSLDSDDKIDSFFNGDISLCMRD